jgi:hypothetical protein
LVKSAALVAKPIGRVLLAAIANAVMPHQAWLTKQVNPCVYAIGSTLKFAIVEEVTCAQVDQSCASKVLDDGISNDRVTILRGFNEQYIIFRSQIYAMDWHLAIATYVA